MADPRARTVRLAVEYLDHEIGHWCRRCLLSTGMLFWVAVRGPRGMHLQLKPWCHECGGTDVEISRDGPHA